MTRFLNSWAHFFPPIFLHFSRVSHVICPIWRFSFSSVCLYLPRIFHSTLAMMRCRYLVEIVFVIDDEWKFSFRCEIWNFIDKSSANKFLIYPSCGARDCWLDECGEMIYCFCNVCLLCYIILAVISLYTVYLQKKIEKFICFCEVKRVTLPKNSRRILFFFRLFSFSER